MGFFKGRSRLLRLCLEDHEEGSLNHFWREYASKIVEGLAQRGLGGGKNLG